MIIFLIFNLFNMGIGGFFLWFEIEIVQKEDITQESFWIAMLEIMRLNFIIMLILYLCTICRSPGYTK